ncbi:AAA-ATPase ASD, mitochondrial-like [Durio zibethinus]|uniref:AAA-ATPase ASD, mitochondrial-like n=1 Tax=Durio zibethinus TaxID=66656 RepID=A0A6P5WWV4_DURZI|nr:AAA-ATPase ASD, mitochondrial-like [Durio zibethinus]
MGKLGGETLATVGSSIPALMFTCATFKQFFPHTVKIKLEIWWDKLVHWLFPEVQITFNEYGSSLYNRSVAYDTVESYLCSKSVAQAARLKAVSVKKDQPLVLAMDDYEEVHDEFQGIKVSWYRGKESTDLLTNSIYPSQTNSIYSRQRAPESRYYQLTFPEKHREFVTGKYLKHVMQEGKALKKGRRFRRLYMKNPSDGFWDYAIFQHPSTFDTYAMDAKRKKAIINDLITFSRAKDYYAKIGKVWKRGYLLYGPPGTGKSTMIAAMSNLLGYDIYDLELTTIKDNAELKTLLINTKSKSIIVVEDIDCSLDFTGKRKETDEEKKEKANYGESKVTLSGFLNFVDGIWSACEGERIFVFTTNHVEKLDPALIRRGRMDMHIELSYCCFEAFKVLARNYWNIDSHPLFEKIKQLFSEVNMTPADVAENLMPKTLGGDVITSLETLIQALETVKEGAGAKTKEEAKVDAEEEEAKKEEEEEEV